MLKRAAVYLPFVFLGLMFSSPTEAAKELSAQQLLNKVEKKLSAPNENATLSMSIKDGDGSTKERTLQIKRKNSKNDQKALVKLIEPVDLRGVGLLSVNKAGEENQWIYLPSSKRSRRITGSGSSGKFLDSDFSYEDLRITTYKTFKNSISGYEKGNDGRLAVVVSEANENTDSTYSKVKSWVNTKYFRVEKSEYYDKSGKLIKTISFQDYRAIDKKYWRAKKVLVTNVQTKSSTLLELQSLRTKGIEDSEISLGALESL